LCAWGNDEPDEDEVGAREERVQSHEPDEDLGDSVYDANTWWQK
jgi:hypothetical protein